MNDRKALQSAIRVVAENLTNAANDLARVLNSIASSLETSAPDDSAASAPAPRSKATRQAPRAAPAGARKTRAKRASPAPVTDRTVAAAMAELGPATSTQIADHINQAAGRRVIDGRVIRGHARRLGARVVVRRGERLYRL
jgi:hypothetical protein